VFQGLVSNVSDVLMPCPHFTFRHLYIYTHIHTHSLSHTQTDRDRLTHTHTHTHTQTHTNTHKHTQTHTHWPHFIMRHLCALRQHGHRNVVLVHLCMRVFMCTCACLCMLLVGVRAYMCACELLCMHVCVRVQIFDLYACINI
jgi:hypothetical protein